MHSSQGVIALRISNLMSNTIKIPTWEEAKDNCEAPSLTSLAATYLIKGYRKALEDVKFYMEKRTDAYSVIVQELAKKWG